MYDDGDIKTKPQFKKATPEELLVFKVKLEKEKRQNFKKRITVITIAVLLGLWAFYFIVSG